MRFAGMRLGAGACCAAVGLAGCAGAAGVHQVSASASGSAPKATADLPAGDILRLARAAGAGVSSFTMAFAYTPDPSNPDAVHLSAQLSRDRSGDCTGHVAIGGKGSAELTVSHGTTWLKPDARFARAEFGPAAVALLKGKYLKGPSADPRLADVSMTADGYQKDLCEMGVYLLSVPDEGDEQATKLGRATIGGVPAIDVMPSGKGTTDTFVAAEGTPYVIEVGKQPGVYFTGYNKPVAIHVPPADQTVDTGSLHG